MLKSKLFRVNEDKTGTYPLKFLIITAVSIFLAESLIMTLLPMLHDFGHRILGIIDALLITLILIPELYLFLYRPMKQYIEKSQAAEERLVKINNNLEQLVAERTSELVKLNKLLETEYTEALKLSEEKYKTVVNNLCLGVIVISPKMEILSVNSQIINWFPQVDPQLNQQCCAVFNCYKRNDGNCPVIDTLQDGRIHEIIHSMSVKNETRDFRLIFSPIKADSGEVISVIITVEDITLRKQAEQTIKELNSRLEQRISERTNELEKAYQNLKLVMNETVNAFVKIVEKRDPYTAGHEYRVAQLASAIAHELGLPEKQIEGLYIASKLHDIGKMYAPADILNKPGKLSEYEFAIIKTHVQAGYEILKDIHFDYPVADMVLQHHEKIDGTGYPFGLTGKDILFEAKILAVADVVEAMASHRPYRPALGLEKALAEISSGSGTKYDPEVVNACIRLFTEKGFKLENFYVSHAS